MEWFWCRYDFILTLPIFILILFVLRVVTMSRSKSDTLIFVDNKGLTWEQAL